MSVTLVAPVATPWTPVSNERASHAAIIATRATTFLRAQAQWLRRGLEHADDPIALGIVLAAHDRSHERWVGHVNAVTHGLGDTAANGVSQTYAYLGRLAASLESGTMQLLDPEIASQARHLLADRLTDITEQAVEALWKAAATV